MGDQKGQSMYYTDSLSAVSQVRPKPGKSKIMNSKRHTESMKKDVVVYGIKSCTKI